MRISKNIFQVLCFLFFSLSYLAVINVYLRFTNSDMVIFVPGTLLIGLAGYWIGGYVYTHYFDSG